MLLDESAMLRPKLQANAGRPNHAETLVAQHNQQYQGQFPEQL
jgi:hypothetical protein